MQNIPKTQKLSKNKNKENQTKHWRMQTHPNTHKTEQKQTRKQKTMESCEKQKTKKPNKINKTQKTKNKQQTIMKNA